MVGKPYRRQDPTPDQWTLTIKYLLASLCPNSKNCVYQPAKPELVFGFIPVSSFLSASHQQVFLTLFSPFHPLLPYLVRPCCFRLPTCPCHSHQRDHFCCLPLTVPSPFQIKAECFSVRCNTSIPRPDRGSLPFSFPCICYSFPSLYGNSLF